MTLGQTTQDQFQDDCQRGLAASECSPLPLSIKAFAHWSSVVESAFGQAPTLLPTQPWLPASEVKQLFFSTSLTSLLAFERRATRCHFRLHDGPFLYAVGPYLKYSQVISMMDNFFPLISDVFSWHSALSNLVLPFVHICFLPDSLLPALSKFVSWWDTGFGLIPSSHGFCFTFPGVCES